MTIMEWSYDDPITGERLQSVAEASVLTPSIRAFHLSLSPPPAHEIVVFPGTHTELEPHTALIDRLRTKRSIFVYSHLLESFVHRVLPRLDHRFVLVSHNSDHGVDERFQAALDDPRIIHWFAQNALVRHPKLSALPIGVANAQWPHGDIRALVEVAARRRPAPRSVVYVNFDTRTNLAVRLPLLQRLGQLPLVHRAAPRPFAAYLAEMTSCRWVISPPGNGVDCHRTWEALYLGVTPVVLRTEGGAGLHDGLPIIQLTDLTRLDEASLEEAERRCAAEPGRLDALTMRYWRDRIGAQAAHAGH
jgi:hypothetical protein